MKQQNIDELKNQLDLLLGESKRVLDLWQDNAIDERLADSYREYGEAIAKISSDIIDITLPLE